MRSIDASLDRTPGKCYAVFTDGDGNQEAESVPRRSSILAFPRHPAKATASRWLRLRSSEGATSGSRNHLCVAVRSLTENLEHRRFSREIIIPRHSRGFFTCGQSPGILAAPSQAHRRSGICVGLLLTARLNGPFCYLPPLKGSSSLPNIVICSPILSSSS